MNDLSYYEGKVPTWNKGHPSFMRIIDLLANAMVDIQAATYKLVADFDIDTAVGVQLDQVGLWIGESRSLVTPISPVYFSFNTVGLGFNQGVWQGPFDPVTQITYMDDVTYRAILKVKALANEWDGSFAGLLPILNAFYLSTGVMVTVQDNQNMTMTVNYVTIYTNMLIFTQTFTDPAWQTQSINDTITSNFIAAPDGTITASKYAITTSANTYIGQTFKVIAPGNTFCFSLWILQGTSVLFPVQLTLKEFGSLSNIATATVYPTTTWTRVFITGIDLDVVGKTLIVYINPTDATAGDFFYIWGAQLEFGNTPSVYEPHDAYVAIVPPPIYRAVINQGFVPPSPAGVQVINLVPIVM